MRVEWELSPLGDWCFPGYPSSAVGVVGRESSQNLPFGLSTRSLQQLRPYAGIAIGLVLGLLSLVVYISAGYSKGMLWLWLLSLAVLAVSFSPYNSITPDLVAAARERQAKIVSITDSTFSPLVKLSDAAAVHEARKDVAELRERITNLLVA